ncbi:MAG: hypothetical protein J5973_06250, partial [Eubacterium sp.]|nr:hypothetical protein [Eubacterium sp.]
AEKQKTGKAAVPVRTNKARSTAENRKQGKPAAPTGENCSGMKVGLADIYTTDGFASAQLI